MKILVDELPKEPKDCVFSVLEIRGGTYTCTLRQYLPEADERGSGYKPRCICKDCGKCDKLQAATHQSIPDASKEAPLPTTLVMEGSDQFKTVAYKPTCRHGQEDCIHDPAYIKATYPEWYADLYGDIEPECAALYERGCALCTDAHWLYDDEDK